MSYFAVPELPTRTLWASLRHRNTMATWHSVVDYSPAPIQTLCGFRSALDAHRTWEQTLPEARCPRCEQLTVAAQMAQRAMVAAEAAPVIGPVKAELLRRRVMENA